MKKTIGIALLIATMSFFIYSFDYFSSLDNKIYDHHFKTQRTQALENSIVILTIDDESLEKISEWPWSRALYSNIVDTLRAGNAKIIAFDINFDTHTKFDRKNNKLFNRSIQNHPNIIFSRRIKIYNKKTSFLNLRNQSINSNRYSILHQSHDADYSVRRHSLLVKIRDAIYPCFALDIAAAYLDSSLTDDAMSIQNHILKINNLNIPLDKHNKMLINYSTKSHSIPIIPILKILDPNFLKYNPKLFTNKIVLIGTTASELQDIYPTPPAATMDGIEIQAHTIQTIINKQFIKTIPHIYYLLIILIPSLLISILAKRINIIGGFLFLVLFNYALFLSAKILFQHHIVLNVFASLFSLFLSYLASILYRFLVEEKQKKEELRHARLLSITRMSVSLNHEINNPLAFIMMGAQLSIKLANNLLLSADKSTKQVLKTILDTSEKTYIESKHIAKILQDIQHIQEPIIEDYVDGTKMIKVKFD